MRRFLITIPFASLVLAGAAAYIWWHSPATTTGDQGSQKVSTVLSSDTALKPWQTSYFTTRIPETLLVKVSNDATDHGNYLLTSRTERISDQVGVTVAELGNNSLNEIPAVRLRLSQPETYAVSEASYAPAGAYVFTNDDAYETSVFWQHGNEYVAVVASGTAARRAELQQALQSIVSNWNWQ